MAEEIEKKGELMGPRAAKKTMLAKQVLQELNAGGRVSKKTQLAVDDAARAMADRNRCQPSVADVDSRRLGPDAHAQTASDPRHSAELPREVQELW